MKFTNQLYCTSDTKMIKKETHCKNDVIKIPPHTANTRTKTKQTL